MNLLVVTQHFWPEEFGINRLVRSLSKKEVRIIIITGQPNYPSGDIFNGYRAFSIDKEYWEEVLIIRVPIIPRKQGGAFRLGANYLSFIVSCALFGPWLLKNQKIDAVFVYATSPLLQALPAIFFSALKKCKVFIWIQDIWPDSLIETGYVENKIILLIVEAFVKFIYKKADCILAQSSAFVDLISSRSGRDDIIYFPNSASSIEYSEKAELYSSYKELISNIKNQFSVVFTGNIGSAQSIETIISAAYILKDNSEICFFIIGDGSKYQSAKEEICKLNLNNIIMPGWIDANMMPEIWKAADVLLVTLVNRPSFSLTIPNKIQCYMAAGKPIIASLAGEGSKLIIESGAGYSCEPENAFELSQCVIKLKDMTKEERCKLGNNAEKYYLKYFSLDKLSNELIDIINSKILTRP